MLRFVPSSQRSVHLPNECTCGRQTPPTLTHTPVSQGSAREILAIGAPMPRASYFFGLLDEVQTKFKRSSQRRRAKISFLAGVAGQIQEV